MARWRWVACSLAASAALAGCTTEGAAPDQVDDRLPVEDQVPDCTFEGEAGEAVKRPDVVGESVSEAEELLEAVGLQLEVVSGSGRVVAQSPAARTWGCVGTVVQVQAEP